MFRMLDPFAYLSATLNLYKEPLEIVAGKPLELAYGVALWDGEIPAERGRSDVSALGGDGSGRR